MKYKRHIHFEKQIKKLIRKFKTLEGDLLVAQTAAIELLHIHKLDNNSVEVISGFCNDKVKIFKIKKFACRSLKGKGVKSGMRIVYAFYPELMEVEFLEIYYKERMDSDMDYGFARGYFEERDNSTKLN